MSAGILTSTRAVLTLTVLPLVASDQSAAQGRDPAPRSSLFSFISIAASGRGTLVRVDVNNGAVLGEYLTAPSRMARDPSRTTVDRFGNTWIANRAENGVSDGVNKGSVTRIGVIVGGRRSDRTGAPHPEGQYLKPPFLHNSCVDRDRDGLIRTSRTLGDTLPWTNHGDADTHGGVATASDECIISYARVFGTGARTLAVDAANDLWVGGFTNHEHEKVSGVTGKPLPGTRFNLGCGGYGGLIDRQGVLWSAGRASGLLRYDPAGGEGRCIPADAGDYGLGVDPETGDIWQTYLHGNLIARLGPDGSLKGRFSTGAYHAQGVVVDPRGNVWIAHSLMAGYTTVGRLRTDGTFLGNIRLPGGVGPTGVAVDANGKVWVVNHYSANAMRIDPDAGPRTRGGLPAGEVDLTVDLGKGAAPYNYSDMTGVVALATLAAGRLEVVAANPQKSLGLSASEVALIFDASGSMWARLGNRTKIQAAKEVLSATIRDLPDGIMVGLRVFGHRTAPGRPGACQDSELLAPLAALDRPRLLRLVNGVTPRGTTPIAHSLASVAEDFSKAPGEKLVVLVTDGEEECRGDPERAVARLLDQGLEVRVNIVGFGLATEAAKARMRRVAEVSAGQYFDVARPENLGVAITTALALRFAVLDQGGTRVAAGVVGGGPLELPPGVYTIVIHAVGQPVTVAGVTVRASAPTTVEVEQTTQGVVGRVRR